MNVLTVGSSLSGETSNGNESTEGLHGYLTDPEATRQRGTSIKYEVAGIKLGQECGPEIIKQTKCKNTGKPF